MKLRRPYKSCITVLFSDLDSCTMQDFSIGLDSDSDPLIEMYVIGRDLSLGQRS